GTSTTAESRSRSAARRSSYAARIARKRRKRSLRNTATRPNNHQSPSHLSWSPPASSPTDSDHALESYRPQGPKMRSGPEGIGYWISAIGKQERKRFLLV